MNTQDITNFIDTFLEKVDTLGIDYSNYNIDHVAYQAASSQNYGNIVKELQMYGNLVHEPLIGGRHVGMIQLTNPIEYKNNKIIALEIIEPRPGQICESGWEHAEFVISETFEDLIAKYPTLKWDTSSADRPIYAHLKLKLDLKTQVKFHKLDILETIKLDK
jgi:predicted metalloenzyme YecM